MIHVPLSAAFSFVFGQLLYFLQVGQLWQNHRITTYGWSTEISEFCVWCDLPTPAVSFQVPWGFIMERGCLPGMLSVVLPKPRVFYCLTRCYCSVCGLTVLLLPVHTQVHNSKASSQHAPQQSEIKHPGQWSLTYVFQICLMKKDMKSIQDKLFRDMVSKLESIGGFWFVSDTF